MVVFVISPLPPLLLEPVQTAGPLRSTEITPLLRYCGPIRHPLAFPPISRFSVIRSLYAPPISRRGEEGFSSCLAHPCHRAVATTPPECPAAPMVLGCGTVSKPMRVNC